MKVLYSLILTLVLYNVFLVKGESLSSSKIISILPSSSSISISGGESVPSPSSSSTSSSSSSSSSYSSKSSNSSSNQSSSSSTQSSSTSSSSSIQSSSSSNSDSSSTQSNPIVYECIDAGGLCDDHFKFCKLGYACLDFTLNNETYEYIGICKEALKEGDICHFDSECGLGMQCSDSYKDEDSSGSASSGSDSGSVENQVSRCIDISFASVGESCEKSYQCLGSLKCINSICSQDKDSTTCDALHNCPSQYYCGSVADCKLDEECSDESLECLKVKPAGGSCIYGYECDYNSTCVNNVCIPKYSLKEGEDCSNYDRSADACESSMVIYDSEWTLRCANSSLNQQNCIENGCNGLGLDYYFCDTTTNKCEPSISTSQDCKQARIERDTCYINHNCVLLNTEPTNDAYYNPKSCYMRNCQQETMNFLYQCAMPLRICNFN